MRSEIDHLILSRPVPVHWAGWRTTTVELQHSGWKLAVQYNFNEDNYRLGMHNDHLQLMAVSLVHHELGRHLADARMMYNENARDLPPFVCHHVAPKILTVSFREIDEVPTWHPIDAQTRMATHQTHQRDVMDTGIFAKHDPGKDVMIRQANKSVLERLEEIIREQEPLQKEIRASIKRESATVTPIRTLLAVA